MAFKASHRFTTIYKQKKDSVFTLRMVILLIQLKKQKTLFPYIINSVLQVHRQIYIRVFKQDQAGVLDHWSFALCHCCCSLGVYTKWSNRVQSECFDSGFLFMLSLIMRIRLGFDINFGFCRSFAFWGCCCCHGWSLESLALGSQPLCQFCSAGRNKDIFRCKVTLKKKVFVKKKRFYLFSSRVSVDLYLLSVPATGGLLTFLSVTGIFGFEL